MTWLVQDDLDEPTRFALMLNKQKMRLPYDPSCVDCGETRVWALRPPLVWEDGTVRCWQCHELFLGRRPWQWHHLGGDDTPLPPVPIPQNLHYLLSRIQDATWQKKAPSGSPAAITIDIAACYVSLLLTA